ncbi:MAG: hypothetical protein FWB85_03915 [Chitinispirillia bacterium]|nr:hypothetical protein [Chitinispirillia bacterium]MCL2241504.1 hypothetical protein [Chitinispirillia bacterium]
MSQDYISDVKLEWYLLNALPEEEQARIAALEQTDAELRARIEALRASDAEILAEYPPSRMAERLAQMYSGAHGIARSRRRSGGKRKWPVSVFILAALLVILPMMLILVPAFIETIEATHHDEDGIVVDTLAGDSAGTVAGTMDVDSAGNF